MRKLILVIVGLVGVVTVVSLIFTFTRKEQEGPDLSFLQREMKSTLYWADLVTPSDCETRVSIWVEKAAAEEFATLLSAMIDDTKGRPSAEYARWLGDHILDTTNRIRLNAEDIIYACDED